MDRAVFTSLLSDVQSCSSFLFKPGGASCSHMHVFAVQVLATNLLQRHIRWAIDAGPLSAKSVSWLYALTARLERPLTQDVMASLRALFKHCAKMRCSG